MSLSEAYAAVQSERLYQKRLEQEAGDNQIQYKQLGDYVVFLRCYMNQTINAHGTVWDGGHAALCMIRKVTALIVAYFEDYQTEPYAITPFGSSLPSIGDYINLMNVKLREVEAMFAGDCKREARNLLLHIAGFGYRCLSDYGAPQRPNFEVDPENYE